ncbi:MAG: hypothetical protein HC824_02045 [Synechococcales cyanobacterium RM1_1_8]|nr:hypothetical protein [Synechococcales cyanobacterium RM1_1_8]
MTLPEPDSHRFDLNMPDSNLQDPNLQDPNLQDPNSKAYRHQQDLKKLKRIYISLIVGGMAIGGLLSLGLIWLLNHWGLTQRPG